MKTESLPPIGFTVMLLRGATSDLSTALTEIDYDSSEVMIRHNRLAEIVCTYNQIKKNPEALSIVLNTWITVGDDSLKAAETILENASYLLRSRMTLVEFASTTS